ncbi:hypothetical protein GGF50DRAFT_121406 [Schizophyllum commune]
MRVGHFLKAPFSAAMDMDSALAEYPPAQIYELWHQHCPRAARPFLQATVKKYALDLALQESDAIIKNTSLKIKLKDLTIGQIRELLNPDVLESRLRELAPFVWSILEVFCSSPNRYRKAMSAKERREAGNQEEEEEDELSGGGDEDENWEDDPHADMDYNESEGEKDTLRGFLRSPVLVVLVCISMLAFTRNKATNLLPLLLGIFFKISGTSSRVILALSNMGLSVSGKQVERLKERISDDALRLATDLMTDDNALWYFLFDNINIYLRKHQQRLTNRNQMLNATNTAIIRISPPVDIPAVHDLKAKLSLRGKRRLATWQDIAPTALDDQHMEKAFEFHIMDLIARFCPGSGKWKDRTKLLERVQACMPQDRPLPTEKTDARPFGVFDVNEGSKKGVIELLKAAQVRSTLSEEAWSSKTRIVTGDWLSSNNVRLARRDRSDDVDSMERLEYVEELSMLWHFALQATHMIMRTHYGRAGLDPTSLASHKGLLRRTWDVNKANYAAAKSLTRHSLIARICHIIMVLCNVRSWKDLQNWSPKSFEDLQKLAQRIRLEFASVNAAEDAKHRGDDWYAHDVYFIRDSLIFLEFESAVSWADAGRVLRVMRYWMMMFRGAGQHNYARECAEVLLRWQFETTPEMRAALEKSWFINRFGAIGRWIASDLWLEQCNFHVKRVFIAQGNGVTIEYIMKKGSACVEAFRDISHLTARFFGDSDRARRSKEASFFEDIRALVNDMQKNKLHDVRKSEPRFVPAQKKGNRKIAPSSVFDVMAAGSEVWQNGKFKEYIAATTYDPAVGYEKARVANDRRETRLDTGTALDDEENPLSYDSFEDVHGDEFGDVSSSSLGGGGDYATGQGLD